MNPKINSLLKPIALTHTLFPDFEQLKFGVTENGVVLFDATLYAESIKIEFSYIKFAQACNRDITIISQTNNMSQGELFWANSDGHILIHRVLVFEFLRYILIDNAVYFDTLLEACLRDGIAFSDTLISQLAFSNLSKNDLEEILKARNEQE